MMTQHQIQRAINTRLSEAATIAHALANNPDADRVRLPLWRAELLRQAECWQRKLALAFET